MVHPRVERLCVLELSAMRLEGVLFKTLCSVCPRLHREKVLSGGFNENPVQYMPSTDLANTIAHSWCGYGGGFSCEPLSLGPTRFEQLLKKKNAAFFIVLHQCTTLLQAWLPIAAALSFVAARVAPMGTAPMAPLGGQQQIKELRARTTFNQFCQIMYGF